jgi:hypothetical protein
MPEPVAAPDHAGPPLFTDDPIKRARAAASYEFGNLNADQKELLTTLADLAEQSAALLVERQQAENARMLCGSEIDWLIGYLSETDEHAADHARRARVALAGE